LGNGKNIQLVSALFMQLVQTPAMQSERNQSHNKHLVPRHHSRDTQNSDEEGYTSGEEKSSTASNDPGQDPLSRLARLSNTLFDDAFRSAKQIVGWMVEKASKVTKSGDSPYRNILDLFVEDLTVVLPSTDWPASELLLTVLAARMISLVKNDKSASIKNMALESLGVMGSAVSVAEHDLVGVLRVLLKVPLQQGQTAVLGRATEFPAIPVGHWERGQLCVRDKSDRHVLPFLSAVRIVSKASSAARPRRRASTRRRRVASSVSVSSLTSWDPRPSFLYVRKIKETGR
jgi:hypothetical protein